MPFNFFIEKWSIIINNRRRRRKRGILEISTSGDEIGKSSFILSLSLIFFSSVEMKMRHFARAAHAVPRKFVPIAEYDDDDEQRTD